MKEQGDVSWRHVGGKEREENSCKLHCKIKYLCQLDKWDQMRGAWVEDNVPKRENNKFKYLK